MVIRREKWVYSSGGRKKIHILAVDPLSGTDIVIYATGSNSLHNPQCYCHLWLRFRSRSGSSAHCTVDIWRLWVNEWEACKLKMHHINWVIFDFIFRNPSTAVTHWTPRAASTSSARWHTKIDSDGLFTAAPETCKITNFYPRNWHLEPDMKRGGGIYLCSWCH